MSAADEKIDDYIPGIGRLAVRVLFLELHLDPGVDDSAARKAAEAVADEIEGTVSVFRDGAEIFTATSEGIT